MKHDYTTTRIWKETVTRLRLISALTGETMVVIMERLAASELKKISGGDRKSPPPPNPPTHYR